MTKRNIIIGVVGIVAIIAAIGLYNVLQIRNFQFPTAAEAGVSYQTIASIRVTLEEPLAIPPHGGGENCYHNVLRDHLGQTYHQYVFSEATYP